MNELIVVSVAPNHPSGHRNRAGYRFSTEPSVAEVTAEQRETIKGDKYLNVHRRLSGSWFKAFKIDRTENNEKKFADKDPEDWREAANVAPPAAAGDGGSQDATNAQEKATGDQGHAVPSVGMTSSKADVVAALVALELKPGVDFDENAGRNALLGVYKDAVEKRAFAGTK